MTARVASLAVAFAFAFAAGASLTRGCGEAQGATAEAASYSRAAFGGWRDDDHDCQSTRAEVLITRSLVPVTFATARHCTVAGGLWLDEYTGELLRDPGAIDIDHVVALADAWRSGADRWSAQRRADFANDSLELAVTSLHLNRSKSDKGPQDWAPQSEPLRCVYLARWARIKAQWGLTESAPERAALASCVPAAGRTTERGNSGAAPDGKQRKVQL